MIRKIIDGITEALYEEFGENVNIYVDDISQGLEEPCFFVQLINASNQIFCGKRRRLVNQFSVQYYAKNPNDRLECVDVFERMNDCLEYISVDGAPMGVTDMQLADISDGVMTVTMNYNLYGFRKEEDGEKMEQLYLDVSLKRGEGDGGSKNRKSSSEI